MLLLSDAVLVLGYGVQTTLRTPAVLGVVTAALAMDTRLVDLAPPVLEAAVAAGAASTGGGVRLEAALKV